MTIHFEAADSLHPYTAELIHGALQEIGHSATLDQVVQHCENAVARDNGQHLHRNDGAGSVGDSEGGDWFYGFPSGI